MLIYITNRNLCKRDFLQQIEQLAKGKPQAIMLREKDLHIGEYEALAKKVHSICQKNNVPLIINQQITVAEKLKIGIVQLSMPNLRKYRKDLQVFDQIGASVHSIEEAKEAISLGATYLIAGHIFSTDSKKGVPPRGLSFLKQVCDAVSLPVFAIGGITRNDVNDIKLAGAKGVCMMSEAMTCEKPAELANEFQLK
jgi:thiamine-phosphate diphosphorylase